MNRVEWLLSGVRRSSRILEIGAGYNPVASKSAGWRTHVVDHASQDDLRRKYATANVNVAAIEEVDTIWSGGALDDSIPPALHGQFELLIASHLIEHLPDLLGFLISCERLMSHDGLIALAIPDRRYCFDCFRQNTMTGDVLEAHHERRSRHTLRTSWNQLAYCASNDGGIAWGPESPRNLALTTPFSGLAESYAVLAQDNVAGYQDFHAWTFTPASFSLLILELGCLGLIDWHIEQLHGPERFEFFARLKRGASRFENESSLQSERIRLLELQWAETAEQIAATRAVGR